MHPELKAQTEIAIKTKNDRSFIDPANFYESERNSGYKNTGNALYEIENLPQLVSGSSPDCLRKAIELSQDRERLSSIRKTLREKARISPLFDSESFGNDFSKMMKEIWSNYISKNNNSTQITQKISSISMIFFYLLLV